jgi:hypothetical protein
MHHTNLHRKKIRTDIMLMAVTAIGRAAKADTLYSDGVPTGQEGERQEPGGLAVGLCGIA